MKDKPKDTDPLDELFAQELKHLEVVPKKQNWEDIQDNLEHEHFDLAIKRKFQDFERSPSDKVWGEVETQIPLNLRLRNQLQWLSKIAAVLVLGMFAFYLFVERPTQTTIVEITPEQVPFQVEKTSPILADKEEIESFVFDIPATKTKKKSSAKASNKTRKAAQEADDFLASILLDEDEFSDQVNERKMAEILLPIEQLPIESIAAMLVQTNKEDEKENTTIEAEPKISEAVAEIDLQITIPLKVVEDSEVEDLINYYDQQQLKKKAE